MSHQEAVLFSHSVSCSHPPADIQTYTNVSSYTFGSFLRRWQILLPDNWWCTWRQQSLISRIVTRSDALLCTQGLCCAPNCNTESLTCFMSAKEVCMFPLQGHQLLSRTGSPGGNYSRPERAHDGANHFSPGARSWREVPHQVSPPKTSTPLTDWLIWLSSHFNSSLRT